MDCSVDVSHFISNNDSIPNDLFLVIRSGNNQAFLNTLAQHAATPEWTTSIACSFESLLPEICARWRKLLDLPSFITAIARILQIAPYLEAFVASELHDAISETDVLRGFPQTASTVALQSLLLALLRLLDFNEASFATLIRPISLIELFNNHDPGTRYLAIRVFARYMHLSDVKCEQLLQRHVQKATASGVFDDRNIDYAFLSLWEAKRLEDLHSGLASARSSRREGRSQGNYEHVIPSNEFSPNVKFLYGHLWLHSSNSSAGPTQRALAIPTSTTCTNGALLVEALRMSTPLLVIGPPGSGKTLLINDIAAQCTPQTSLLSLHLNEQTDAKTLVGMHVTGERPGTFEWQSGVLTKAMQTGQWILIEDIDRVPSEIMGMLVSVLKRRELRIPGQADPIKAAPGFRLLATLRGSSQSQPRSNRKHVVGMELWRHVQFQALSLEELRIIAVQHFPSIRHLADNIMSVFRALQYASLPERLGSSRDRFVSPRDLLKWCARIHTTLSPAGHTESLTFISESLRHHIFLDAIDVFAGSIANTSPNRKAISDIIASELQISPEQREHNLKFRKPLIELSDRRKQIRFERCQLENRNSKTATMMQSPNKNFSFNRHIQVLMEQIGVAVSQIEPLLLIGETGIGKTAAIQQLAQTLGQRLVVVNLSQQTDSSDLLGGLKPVTIRSLIMPLKDEFDNLFYETFSSRRNKEFSEKLSKMITQSRWKEALKYWKHAVKTVLDSANPRSNGHVAQHSAHGDSKRRKLSTGPDGMTRQRWQEFQSDLNALAQRISDTTTESFAFSFVESDLVRAVKSGAWVLLDEINLAPTDALEALIELLEPTSSVTGSRTIQLAEAGLTQRIEAHPNFRIFAAMNPSTDVGKRELPPGIRGRFTEIYVEPPEQDQECLREIILSCLYNTTSGSEDQQLAESVTQLFLRIKGEALRGDLLDGSGAKPHYSLRSLIRALSYAKGISPRCGILRSLYEGFCMCFATMLNRPSQARLQATVQEYLFEGESAAKRELRKPSQLLPSGKDTIRISVKVVDGLGRGTGKEIGTHEESYQLPKGSEALQVPADYVVTPYISSNLRDVCRAISARRLPILIEGPTSAGKTSMIDYLAKRSGNKFVRINNHEHTDLQEYLGTYVSASSGRLVFQEGVLVQALRNGYWVVLDELNLAPTDVLEALNRLLDENRELLVPESQEIVRPHPNFMLFATQNPPGAYAGRKTLSRAFRNRFVEIQFEDIPTEELEIILTKRSTLPPSFCSKIVNVYWQLVRFRQQSRLFDHAGFATLRDLFRWAFRGADTIEALAIDGFMLLAEKARTTEERNFVRDIICKTLSGKGHKISIDDASLYGAIPVSERPVDLVWTTSMLRLYRLVEAALRNDEPILLVGETGCGKTRICQVLADLARKRLLTVNAHQNLETSDLIGSQRPNRRRQAVETELTEILLSALNHPTAGEAHSNEISLRQLLEQYDRVATVEVPTSTKAKIQDLRIQIATLFEWYDGSLVEAMRQGDYFLLDEISLADDSVLERINSVLDPQRSILLAEKGGADCAIKAENGFRFLATMNPGGDFGKKELSTALRNRFTEIWVPPLSDSDDASAIVSAKIQEEAKSFSRLIVAFARWFTQNYHSSKLGYASIRDLLSWVEYINVGRDSVLNNVIQGAYLVYIDTLGANPSGISQSELDVMLERQRCLVELKRIMVEESSLETSQAAFEVSLDMRNDTYQLAIGGFRIEKLARFSENEDSYFTASTTKANTAKVLRGLQINKPILLEGPPGVGKTTLVTAIANASGHRLIRINLSEQTDLIDLFGSDVPLEDDEVGTFGWRDAPFLTAMKEGHWVLLDEMNLASQSILEGLNACIDHRGEVFIPELGRTFSRHRDFRLFAAQNPHHQGAGRKGLPTSFVNRFSVVYAESFTAADMMSICSQIHPSLDHDALRTIIQLVTTISARTSGHDTYGAYGRPWEFNLRDTLRLLQLHEDKEPGHFKVSLRDAADILLKRRFRTREDRETTESVLDSCFGDRENNLSLYYNLTPHDFQIGNAKLPRLQNHIYSHLSLNLQHRQLSTMESTMLGIEMRWPVLLVGADSTSGLIQSLASATGAKTETLSMSSDMDTNDVIGSFDQAQPLEELRNLLKDIRKVIVRELEHAVFQETEKPALARLSKMLELTQSNSTLNSFTEIERELGDVIKSVRKSLTHGESTQLLSNIDQLSASLRQLSALQTKVQKDNVGFRWIDGPLVKALQAGSWLIIENANFSSPAVLDRLNSLLEPNGVLIINEHCDVHGNPRIIRPHRDFRIFLTMDPRYGEISRAMRNRCVEVYVPSVGESDASLHLPLRAAEFRFAIARDLCLGSDEAFVNYEAILERLSSYDSRYLSTFVQQCLGGLLPSTSAEPLSMVYQHLRQSAQSSVHEALSKTRAERILSEFRREQAWIDHQPVYPSLNAPLTLDLRTYSSTQLILGLDRLLEMVQEPLPIPSTVASANGAPPRIVASVVASNSTDDSFQKLLPLISSQLHAWITSASQLDTISADHLVAVKKLNSLGWVLSNINKFTKLSATTILKLLPLIALRLFGEEIASSFLTASSHTESANNLQDITTMFSCQELCIERMWQTFKTSQFETQADFEFAFQLQSLASQLDRFVKESSAPLEDLTRLTESFHRAMRTVSADERALQELTMQVEQLASLTEEREQQLRGTPHPHFQSLFRFVVSMNDLASALGNCKDTQHDNRHAQYRIMSGASTQEDVFLPAMPSSTQQLHALSTFAHSAASHSGIPYSTSELSSVLIQQASTLSNQAVYRLAPLRAEVDIVGQCVAAHVPLIPQDTAQYLIEYMSTLIHQIINNSLDFLDDNTVSAMSEVVQDFNKPSCAQQRCASNVVLKCVSTYFLPFYNLPTASLPPLRNWSHLSHKLIAFALGCLVLYVPDQVFDPALPTSIEFEVHEHQMNGLVSKLEALSHVESLLTGHRDNLRTIALKKEIQLLQARPKLKQVYRPAEFDLVNLQSEFDSLVQFRQRLESAYENDQLTSLLSSDLLSTIDILVEKFNNVPLGHKDIVNPIVAFLRCLKLGCVISVDLQAAKNPSQVGDDQNSGITTKEGSIFEIDLAQVGRTGSGPTSQVLDQILVLRQAYSCLPRSKRVQEALMSSLRSSCDRWKDSMAKAEAHQVKQSRLYTYRGNEDGDDEIDDPSIARLFGSDEPEVMASSSSSESTPNVKRLASYVAQTCSRIFIAPELDTMQLLDVFERSTRYKERAHMSLMANDRQNLYALALGISRLDQQSKRLNGSQSNSQHYNFYTDMNVTECDEMCKVVSKVRKRVENIIKHWPEHASLHRVLEQCQMLLANSLETSVAKLLQLVEQLHSAVDEWSSVASREFSVKSEMDMLTALIISWRRLELSSWARLLDIETETQAEEADTWWFVAYENTVHRVETLSGASPAELAEHVTSLTATIESLYQNSSIGQFARRIHIIKVLSCCLEYCYCDSEPAMLLANALRNVTYHFQRFLPAIESSVQKGRANITKDIQDVIRLASWKDTNILSLRQSAKASRNKLARLIRTYRDLLSQPCSKVLATPLHPHDISMKSPAAPVERPPRGAMYAPEQHQRLPESFSTWPPRYQNAIKTAERMCDVCGRSQTSPRYAADRLESFMIDVKQSVRHLKEATPTVANEDNIATMKHLTSRKRRLLADTLKDLRQAGLKSDVPVAILSVQDTSAKVFFNSPFLETGYAKVTTEDFHAAIDQITRARALRSSHSEDISSRDMSRALGLVESLFATTINQRQRLSQHKTHLDSCEAVLLALENVASMRVFCTQFNNETRHTFETCSDITARMPTYCDVALELLICQARLGKLDFSSTLDMIDNTRKRFIELGKELRGSPQLPSGITADFHRQLQDKIVATHRHFIAQLSDEILSHPVTKPALVQLLYWSEQELSRKPPDVQEFLVLNLDSVQFQLTKMLDDMLGAIQDIEAMEHKKPKDDINWLTASQDHLFKILSIARVAQMGDDMNKFTDSLQYLSPETHHLAEILTAFGHVQPIIRQYVSTITWYVRELQDLHCSTARALKDLSLLLSQLAENGFCKPAENTEGKTKASDNLESGTGLGQGEGAEDISKDVGADEDLDELAAAKDEQDDKGSIEGNEDAISMDEDFDGADGDVGGDGEKNAEEEDSTEDTQQQDKIESRQDDGGTNDGEEKPGENAGEAVGDVDSTDPSAVDEKYWDEAGSEANEEKAAQKAAKTRDHQEQAATEDDKGEKDNGSETQGSDTATELGEDDVASDSENERPRHDNQLDPHTNQEEQLELPDDLDLDGGRKDDDALSDLEPDEEINMDEPVEGGEDEVVEEEKQNEELQDKDAAEEMQGDTLDNDQQEREQADFGDDMANDAPVDGKSTGLSKGTGDGEESSEIDRGGEGGDPMETGDKAQSDEKGEKEEEERVRKAPVPSTGEGAKNSSDSAEHAQALGDEAATDDADNSSRDVVRKLGDALEQWYQSRRKIKEQRSEQIDTTQQQDVDMTDADFEHLQSEDAQADAQALASATEEQAKPLDLNHGTSTVSDSRQDRHERVLPNGEVEEVEDDVKPLEDRLRSKTGRADDESVHSDGDAELLPEALQPNGDSGNNKNIDDISQDIETMQIDRAINNEVEQHESPADIWKRHETTTSALAQILTEQLSIILEPTVATKLRGDFRTGKRLNIKRIIPYIASSYKRDKIWMRRTIPSKRAYQIQLAIDDSASMAEKGSADLAFSTLALVAKSLSMLEVGEIGVLGFGENVFVAHELGLPFSGGAGESVVSRFNFKQDATNVLQLVERSIELLRDARLKAHGSSVDLWQLQFIISDGLCDHHDKIKKLLAQAHEERMMMVFIIVDAVGDKAEEVQNQQRQQGSIVDMERVEFIQQAKNEDGHTPPSKIKITKYLDTFPFKYFLIVRDVKELPSVLTLALRQWFAEVAGA